MSTDHLGQFATRKNREENTTTTPARECRHGSVRCMILILFRSSDLFLVSFPSNRSSKCLPRRTSTYSASSLRILTVCGRYAHALTIRSYSTHHLRLWQSGIKMFPSNPNRTDPSRVIRRRRRCLISWRLRNQFSS